MRGKPKMKMQVEILVRKPIELDITGATLLSVDEAKTLLSERERACMTWWWLRSPGHRRSIAAAVHFSGSISANGRHVNDFLVAVRPALQVTHLASTNRKIGDIFYFDGERFKIISDHLAFCESTIGHMRFDATNNDYETSEIKKYVDNWFAETVSKYQKENAK